MRRGSRGWAAVVAGLLLLLGPGAAGAQGPRLYVTNQDDATVSIADLSRAAVVTTLDLQPLGFGANAKPHHAQVEPDGAAWYVTLIGAGQVLRLDRENRILARATMEVPGLIALHPSRDLMVVARSMSAVNPPSRIALVRRSDMTLLDEIDVFFPRPHAIVVDPRGHYVYVASLGVNQLASVRLEDGQVSLVDVEGPYHTLTQFSMSPDGRWLLATGSTSNQLLVFEVKDEGKPVLARTVPMEKGPFESIFTRDGRTVFVTNLDANAVTVVDAVSWTAVEVIRSPKFQQPHGLALDPDGQRVWVSNRFQTGGAHDHEGHKASGSGSAVAICIATRSIVAELPVGHYAAGVGTPLPFTGALPAPRPCQ